VWILVRLYNRLCYYIRVNTFEVLADHNRRRILEYLREEERPVGDVVRALGISQPGVSKHLRVLRTAGLVSVRPDAQRRMYRVRFEPLVELDEWLEPYRRVWAERLEALERHLDEEVI
jgi:DNA-binding transcriptional ArsR family regulator